MTKRAKRITKSIENLVNDLVDDGETDALMVLEYVKGGRYGDAAQLAGTLLREARADLYEGDERRLGELVRLVDLV